MLEIISYSCDSMVKGVYKITNDRTGEVYIGQAKDLKRRENTHFRHLAQGKHHNSGLQKDHNKGDTFSFEILEELPDATLADLYNKESQYIKKFNSFREGYNQTPGGAMDQFKGRYEYGGGRLPIEKYQPTDKYLNEVVTYCPECGNEITRNENFCAKCGKSTTDNEETTEIILENKNKNNISKISIFGIISIILGIFLFLNTRFLFMDLGASNQELGVVLSAIFVILGIIFIHHSRKK